MLSMAASNGFFSGLIAKINAFSSGEMFLYVWLPFGIISIILAAVALVLIMSNFGPTTKNKNNKSNRYLVPKKNNDITFKNVAGIEEAKEELIEVVEFLKNPKKFERLGCRAPKGVLLIGTPGTGKTLLARAIAGESNVPFFSISGSDFVEMFVGVGAARIRDLFACAKKHAPCIIFIDEIDAIGRHRSGGNSDMPGHNEREQALNQLLVEMDGFAPNTGIIVIAATNRHDVLDSALLRPGRFDRQVVVSKPDVLGRKEILKIYTDKIPLGIGVDLDILARNTSGFSGADIANLVNEAAISAAKANREVVVQSDFERAIDKTLMGLERKNMVVSLREKTITAYHEAGHALVASLLPNADPVHKVSIIPHSMALGVMQQVSTEDRYLVTRSYALDRITIAFGGRIAEALKFGEITAGASNDIEVATDIARKMVCEWGMSEELGTIAFKKDGNVLSEDTAKRIDKEISNIIDAQYLRAKMMIAENARCLKAISQKLLDFETISGVDVKKIIEENKL